MQHLSAVGVLVLLANGLSVIVKETNRGAVVLIQGLVCLPIEVKFLFPHLKSLFKKVNVERFFIDNYKSALQEYFQKENLPAPVYKTITTKGPDHKKIFIVEVLSQDKSLAKAKGLSKKNAEKRAAQKALKSLMGKEIRHLNSNTFMLKKKR